MRVLQSILIKLAAWKLSGFLRGRKTYVVAALALALGVGVLTGQDTQTVQMLLQQGGEADPVAVLTALFGLGLMALRSGVKETAKHQEKKIDELIEAERRPRCGACERQGVQRKVTAKDIT